MIRGKPKLTVYPDGTQEWNLGKDRKWHCVDGPAIICPGKFQAWYLNGKPHRIGGPARLSNNGLTEWWIDNHIYNFNDYCKELQRLGIPENDIIVLKLKYDK